MHVSCKKSLLHKCVQWAGKERERERERETERDRQRERVTHLSNTINTK